MLEKPAVSNNPFLTAVQDNNPFLKPAVETQSVFSAPSSKTLP